MDDARLLAVGRKGRFADAAAAFNRGECLACLQIPQSSGIITTTGQRTLSIRRESHAVDEAGMTGEGFEYLAGLRILQPNGVVFAAR
jgi:hypothetical protein